jgi:hypothetical protein
MTCLPANFGPIQQTPTHPPSELSYALFEPIVSGALVMIGSLIWTVVLGVI